MVDQLPSSTGESRICKPSAVSYIIYVWCACHYPLTRSTNLVGWLVQLGRLHGEPRQHQSYLSLSKLNGLLGRSRQWFLRGWTSSKGWKSAWDDPRGIHGKLHNELGIIYIMWSISRKSDFVASSTRVFFRKFTVGYKVHLHDETQYPPAQRPNKPPGDLLIMLNDEETTTTPCEFSPTLQEIFQMKQKPCAGAVIQGLVVSNAILGLHHPSIPVPVTGFK